MEKGGHADGRRARGGGGGGGRERGGGGSVTDCNSRYASGTAIRAREERRKAREKKGEREGKGAGRQGEVFSVDSVEVSPSFRLHGRNTALGEVCDLKSYSGVQRRRSSLIPGAGRARRGCAGRSGEQERRHRRERASERERRRGTARRDKLVYFIVRGGQTHTSSRASTE